jgi:hypothetical protein
VEHVKGSRVLTAAGILGITGLALLPATSRASGETPHGSATAATLKLAVAARALLSTTNGALAQLSSVPGVGSALDQVTSDVMVQLDRASASGALTQGATDIASGEAISTPLYIDYKPINGLLAALQLDLKALSAPALSSLPSAITGQLSQLTSVTQQLAGLNSQLSSLMSGLALNISDSSIADLHMPGKPDLPQQSKSGITVPQGQLAGIGTQLSLAPFTATAVDAAHAPAYQLSAPTVEAANTTEALTVGPQLNLSALNGLDQSLQSLLGQLTSILGTLQQALAQATAASAPGLSAVTGVLQSNPLTAPLAGALSGAAGGASGGGVPAPDLSGLQSLAGQVQGAINALTALAGLNNVLGQIGLSQILQTSGVTATARLHPTSSGGSEALATAQFVDAKVLSLGTQLATQLGVAANTALLEVKGVQSSSQAAFGNGAGDPTASSKLAEIDVLGNPVLTADDVVAKLGVGQELRQPVHTPLGTLTLAVTRGAPHVISNTPTNKSVEIAALDIQLINGDAANGANPLNLPSLASSSGSAGDHIAALGGAGGALVDLALAPTAADVTTNPGPTAPTSCTGQACLPQTGMFGAPVLGAAALLGGLGLALRVIGGRRRRAGLR